MQATDPDKTPQKSPRHRGPGIAAHGAPWQSVLVPHTEAIWNLRKEGKTYRQIRDSLAALGVNVAPSTVMRFIEARKRRAAKISLPDLPGTATATPARSEPRKGQTTAAAALPEATTAPAAKPRTSDPQTDNNGFPLSGRAEVIGHDSAGRPLTRHRPFKGQV